MQDFIAALLAVLGTLLVLAGATVTVVKTVPSATDETGTPAGGKAVGFVRRLNGSDRLIAWGVVLLVLAAIAAGAISFEFGANAGSR